MLRRTACLAACLSACSGGSGDHQDAAGPDAAVVDSRIVDAPFDAPIDAEMPDARPDATPPPDAPPPPDASPPDANPCSCDLGAGCQVGCACDPACAPLRCDPFVPSIAYFGNHGGGMNGVAIGDTDHAWAVGGTGTIMRLTLPAGIYPAVAEPTASPTTATLSDVDAIDMDTGWAVGNGIILRLEGGVWSVWTAYTPPDWLVSLDLVDEDNGMAVGNNGAVAQLRDGVWSTIDIGTTGDLEDVALADRDNGRVCGDQLYELRDGVWSSQPQIPGDEIYDVELIDRDTGWGVGWGGTIRKLVGGFWVDTGDSFLSGSMHTLALTDIDNGVAFRGGYPAELAGGVWGLHPCVSPNCNSIHDVDTLGGVGWGVGGPSAGGGPDLVVVDPAIPTWASMSIFGATSESLLTVAVSGESTIWAGAYDGHFWHLNAGGWASGPTLAESIRRIILTDSTHGWAVGDDGMIFHLAGTWMGVIGPTTAPLYDVVQAPDNTGWAVGGQVPAGGAPGIILRRDISGWSIDPFIPGDQVNAIAITDASTGWAVGGGTLATSGTIFRLEAGVWSTFMTVPDAPLWSIALDADGNGWAVGGTFSVTGGASVPVVWRLLDGAWTQLPMAGDFALHSVAIGPDSVGWAVGSNSAVVALYDGGATICPDAMPWPVDLISVALTPSGHAWAVGTEGMRARTP